MRGPGTLLVPNERLSLDDLPAPESPWSEIVPFAGTFNGYRMQVGVANASAALERARGRYEAAGDVEDDVGLSALRALLFFAQRADHQSGTGYDGEDLDFIHALVEGIRAKVVRRNAGDSRPPDPSAASVGEIEDRVMAAFERLVLEYARWGGHRFHGWTDYDDPHNYSGPVIRSEADCALRLAIQLEREWPEAVHAEFPISKANFANYDPATERRQRVDLAVTDLSAFAEDETSQDRFRSLRHEAFIEVKWLVKGWRGYSFEMDARKRVDSVGVDAAKLANHLSLGRCAAAAAFVVDDEDYFFENSGHLDWPAGVWQLVLGPQTLREYGLLAEED